VTTKQARKRGRPKKTLEEPSLSNKTYKTEEDRLTKIESSVANLCIAVEEILKQFSEKIKDKPQQMPKVVSTDERLAALQSVHAEGDMSQRRKVKDLVHPNAQKSGFQPGDVVSLKESSSKFNYYKINPDGEPAKPDEEGEPARGVVVCYMYTKRNGLRKYKVDFPKFGKDGIVESEMELC